MTVGIMQPYFLPYIGYWQLIAHTDQWVFFDVVQYNKKSWMNRNRILHPDQSKEYQYISVPIRKHSKGTLIKDVYVNNDIRWKDEIFGKLTLYKKLSAPHYHDVIGLLRTIFDHKYEGFNDLAVASTLAVCDYLGINIEYKMASEIKFDSSSINKPGEWALKICQAMNVEHYINPIGGKEIFSPSEYDEAGIKLQFLNPIIDEYYQGRGEFVGGLSIVDVMMWNDVADVKNMLDSYELT